MAALVAENPARIQISTPSASHVSPSQAIRGTYGDWLMC